MGVTYWQIGEKDHAIDLTLNGVELVEKAVDGGHAAEEVAGRAVRQPGDDV